MRVSVLGSGTSVGVPFLGCNCPVCTSTAPKDKRLRSSILLEAEGKTIVFDTGPDFRQQMLNFNVRHLDAVVFTHAHRDHIAGIDDLRPYFFLQGHQPVPMYLETAVLDSIKAQFEYLFKPPKEYTGKLLQLDFKTIGMESFNIGAVELLPIRLMHGPMKVLGFRVKNFAYLTDTNAIPESEYSKLHGLDTMILDCAVLKPHPSHFHLEGALQEIEKIRPKRCYLIHMSHWIGLHDEVNSILPDGVELTYDGLVLDF